MSENMSEQKQSLQELQPSAEQLLHAGSEFLEHFDVKVDPFEQPEEFREALQQLDPRYQGGRDLVRWELEKDQTEWDDTSKDIIMSTAESMRMLEVETPLQGNYDAVIVLGGARQSNLDRTNYAVAALQEGAAKTKHLVVAGSNRALNEAEQENTANYAPGAKTEFDLCVGAAATAAKENPGLIASVLYVEDKKAGTPGVIEKVLTSLQASGDLPTGSKIAAVTTQIYQTSTQRDLDRVARQFGANETFTAGNPSDPKIVANRKPATYLSEVLRTLRAAINDAEAKSTEQLDSKLTSSKSQTKNEGVVDGFSGFAPGLRDMELLDETRPSFGSGDWGLDKDSETTGTVEQAKHDDEPKEGLDQNGRGWLNGVYYNDSNDPGTYDV